MCRSEPSVPVQAVGVAAVGLRVAAVLLRSGHAKDYGRYASILADLHLVALTCLMLHQAAQLAASA